MLTASTAAPAVNAGRSFLRMVVIPLVKAACLALMSTFVSCSSLVIKLGSFREFPLVVPFAIVAVPLTASSALTAALHPIKA
jgi:hypothetical protein